MEFNVIIFNFNTKKFEKYNIFPYFKRCYKEEKKKPVTFKEFKEFFINNSRRMYWSRCEYEILLASWPFGSYKLKENIKKFFDENLYNHLDEQIKCLCDVWNDGSNDNIKNFKNEFEKFINTDHKINMDDYSINTKFYNIITQNMEKIDIHNQIMMNIDVIVKLFMENIK